jgi:hypothetical protein
VAELERTKHRLNRGTLAPTLGTDHQPIPRHGRRVLETAGLVAFGARDDRQLVQRRRLLPARAPPWRLV